METLRAIWCQLFHRAHHSDGTEWTLWMCRKCGIIALKEPR